MFHYNTGTIARNITIFVKVSFNIRDHTIVIGEMSLETQSKVYGGASLQK